MASQTHLERVSHELATSVAGIRADVETLKKQFEDALGHSRGLRNEWNPVLLRIQLDLAKAATGDQLAVVKRELELRIEEVEDQIQREVKDIGIDTAVNKEHWQLLRALAWILGGALVTLAGQWALKRF